MPQGTYFPHNGICSHCRPYGFAGTDHPWKTQRKRIGFNQRRFRGVGHFAVQIAKAYGAKVTAVCSGKNAHFVKSLGADQVIAYDKESIHHHNGRYNLIIDTHGNLCIGTTGAWGSGALW
jgi:hypothetical protein